MKTAKQFIKEEEDKVKNLHKDWGTEHLAFVMKNYALQVCKEQRLICINEQFHESGDCSNAPIPELK